MASSDEAFGTAPERQLLPPVVRRVPRHAGCAQAERRTPQAPISVRRVDVKLGGMVCVAQANSPESTSTRRTQVRTVSRCTDTELAGHLTDRPTTAADSPA